jgi:hypothetical protein
MADEGTREMVREIAAQGSSLARTAIRRGGALQWAALVAVVALAMIVGLACLHVEAWVLALTVILTVPSAFGVVIYLIWKAFADKKPELLVSQELAVAAMEQGVYGQRSVPMPSLPPPAVSVQQLADTLALTAVEPDVLQARELYQRQLKEKP